MQAHMLYMQSVHALHINMATSVLVTYAAMTEAFVVLS